MFASPPSLSAPRNRFSWLWLLIGAALLPFVTIQTEMPLAAWLAPVFLIRFARTRRASVGLPAVALACVGALTIACRGVGEGPLLAMLGATFGIIYALPYLADR